LEETKERACCLFSRGATTGVHLFYCVV